jgi:hypothetical protein
MRMGGSLPHPAAADPRQSADSDRRAELVAARAELREPGEFSGKSRVEFVA